MKKLLIIGLCAFTLTAFTQTNNPVVSASKSVLSALTPSSDALYSGHELDLGIAGTFSANEPRGFQHVLDTNIRHGTYGLNVSSTYFFVKYLGIGTEFGINDIENPSARILDYMDVTATGRIPIGSFAPYVNGGLSMDFRNGDYGLILGPGVEWRFAHSAGLFADVRYNWKPSQDNLTARFGLRFAFW